MKHILVILAFSLGLICRAQVRKPIDWEPCKKVTDQLRAQVDKFNAEHKDGFSITLSCMYSGDPTKRQKPKQKIPLTASEIRHLHALRKTEDAVYGSMTEYEDYLFRAHHVKKPDINKPCYYFVGIVVDTDYITIDPNPMDVQCDEEIKP